MNDVSLMLPLNRFEGIIKIGGEIMIDDDFVGDVYDIKKDFGAGTLEIISRHKIYELTVAEKFDYVKTQKNPIVAIKEIIELFVDVEFIDEQNFSQLANIFSNALIDFNITGDTQESPMSTISTINQMLGLGMYIKNNKIKLFYIPTGDLAGGIELPSSLITRDAKTSYNYDYYKTKIQLNYVDRAAAEQTLETGAGNKTLSIDITEKMKFAAAVAQIIIDRLALLYGKIYESIDIEIRDTTLIDIGIIIYYNSVSYIIKNISKSNGKIQITGIGG